MHFQSHICVCNLYIYVSLITYTCESICIFTRIYAIFTRAYTWSLFARICAFYQHIYALFCTYMCNTFTHICALFHVYVLAYMCIYAHIRYLRESIYAVSCNTYTCFLSAHICTFGHVYVCVICTYMCILSRIHVSVYVYLRAYMLSRREHIRDVT